MESDKELPTSGPRRHRFRFDAVVEGPDRTVGTLHSVLLAPDSLRVVGLGISTGILFPREVRVPLAAVTSATGEVIRIALTVAEVDCLRRKQLCAKTRKANPAAAVIAGYHPAPVLPVRGACRMVALDGTAGRLRQLVADASTGELAELVVETGLFTIRSLRVPAGWVQRVSNHDITVQATLSAIASLPPYRGDRELRASILDAWLYDATLRPMFLRAPLEVSVCEGVVTMEGYAWSRTLRQRLVTSVREIPGIQEVNCAVVTDDELEQAVTTALGQDLRTWQLRPHVCSSLGIVCLEGVAPDQPTREAAVEVASSVPFVRAVTNRLRIGSEGGPGYRLLWQIRSPVLSTLLSSRGLW